MRVYISISIMQTKATASIVVSLLWFQHTTKECCRLYSTVLCYLYNECTRVHIWMSWVKIGRCDRHCFCVYFIYIQHFPLSHSLFFHFHTQCNSYTCIFFSLQIGNAVCVSIYIVCKWLEKNDNRRFNSYVPTCHWLLNSNRIYFPPSFILIFFSFSRIVANVIAVSVNEIRFVWLLIWHRFCFYKVYCLFFHFVVVVVVICDCYWCVANSLLYFFFLVSSASMPNTSIV